MTPFFAVRVLGCTCVSYTTYCFMTSTPANLLYTPTLCSCWERSGLGCHLQQCRDRSYTLVLAFPSVAPMLLLQPLLFQGAYCAARGVFARKSRIPVDGEARRAEGTTRRAQSVYSSSLHLRNTGPCLLYTSPSPRDLSTSRMPSSA